MLVVSGRSQHLTGVWSDEASVLILFLKCTLNSEVSVSGSATQAVETLRQTTLARTFRQKIRLVKIPNWSGFNIPLPHKI